MTRATKPTLVLVAGSGRSGTSLFSGILQRLGAHVPQPEVTADATNPKGFAESRWVVDFHTRLLRAARVQVADARPAAWAETARICLDPAVIAELHEFLHPQFARASTVLVKDPRLSWFLPLWRGCAEEAGADVRFVTMLRHPAAVVDSKLRWYGGGQDEAARTAGWCNQTLFTERATRDGRRVFVRYDDLLEDWVRTIGGVGDALGLSLVTDAPATALRDAHGFVDAGLSRSRADWDGLRVPEGLRSRADEIWAVASSLAGGTAAADTPERLDVLRAGYIRLYEDAEAVASSSIAAARADARDARPEPVAARGRGTIAIVPVSLKRKVPPHVRARVRGVIAGS